jgi:hypothetical protein
MKSTALLVAGCLLAMSGFSANASSIEPIELPKTAPAVEQPVVAEQSHLQAASSAMRSVISRDGDLPLEFKKPTGPRGHNLLNLSF